MSTVNTLEAERTRVVDPLTERWLAGPPRQVQPACRAAGRPRPAVHQLPPHPPPGCRQADLA
eukprot:3652190-Alexandrium_andersonii.AAC.1